MGYIKITNGKQEPYDLGQLRRDNKATVSFPKVVELETLESYGVYTVVTAETPNYDEATQVLSRDKEAADVDGQWTYGFTIRYKTQEELAAIVAQKRAGMSCSKMQGILTLGETKWGEVLTYREDVDTTWAEKMIIDSAQDWQRTSENIQFFGYLIGYTDEQMDEMFTKAQEVTA
jgi:hypothetical protein